MRGWDFHEGMLGKEVCQIGSHHVALAEMSSFIRPSINSCHSSGFIKCCSYHETRLAATQLCSPCLQGFFSSRPLCKSTSNQPQRWLRRSVLCFYLSSVHPCSLQINTPQPRKGLSSAFQFRGNIELIVVPCPYLSMYRFDIVFTK